MSDEPNTNDVLEDIAAAAGGVYDRKTPRKQIDILEEIASNIGTGGGGGGPAYDDTAIKQRVTATEDKNDAQDQSLTQLTQAIQTANQNIASVTDEVNMLQLYHSQMIVPWGDSRSAQNWNTNTTPAAPLARSWLWWAEALSQRVRMNVDYMQGVSGDRMIDLINRIQTDAVPTGGFGTKKPSEVPPCIAALMCWTNSVNAGTPLDDLVAQTNLVLDYLLARGHKVLLIAEWPRAAGSGLTADNKKLMLAIHNALLKIRRKDVYIVDVWPRVADPASADGYPLPNMLNPDDLHNSPGIAMITGQEIARVLEEEMSLPRLKMTTSSNADQYDAVLQPQGCLNTNPMLITPGGTLGTGATGAAPLGYTLSATNGLAVVGSFVDTTLADGSKRKAFRIVISGTPTAANSYVSLRQSGILSKVAVNDILEANYEVSVANGHANLGSTGLMIDTGLAATRAHGGLSLTGDNIVPTQAVFPFYGVPRSADLTIGATLPASISFEMRAYATIANVAASATIDILSSGLRKKKV
uniref:Adenylosuccinate synthetase n=1 Tax=Pseudomonas phage Arace01 TaxID=3138526 RepID=A0AAU6VZ82_9VIRU